MLIFTNIVTSSAALGGVILSHLQSRQKLALDLQIHSQELELERAKLEIEKLKLEKQYNDEVNDA